jgi:DtxR family Mn-dependent transcriptional regulator
MITLAEENYLKAILTISLKGNSTVSTNEIAHEMGTSPASVSDMLKKLADKKFIKHQKYKGVKLNNLGKSTAISILRRHRLWETFLVNKLDFNWSQVHEVAEQLEHIKSAELIDKLDNFLGHPRFDPHGEPIPTKKGEILKRNTISLSKLKAGQQGVVMGVNLDEVNFLDYLNKLNIKIGSQIKVMETEIFDQKKTIKIKKKEKKKKKKKTKNKKEGN